MSDDSEKQEPHDLFTDKSLHPNNHSSSTQPTPAVGNVKYDAFHYNKNTFKDFFLSSEDIKST